MKRRSARPFMVEVKTTRTARASLTSPNLRTRPDTILWPELIEAEAKPPQPDMPLPAPPRQERKEVEAPVRRVLPSLVPMFQVSAETETETETEDGVEAVAPPVRRSRTRREPGPAVDKAAAVKATVAAPAPKPAAKPRPAAARPEPVDAPAAHAPAAELAQGPSPRPAPWRRTKELRLGERWKRRLPHFAR